MYSFYGGQKGQDFKITRIFSNRAVDMVGDLKMRWTSPVNVGDYIFINYGDPSFMNEETSNYNTNLQIDLKASGKSFTNSLWQKIYVDRNLTVSPEFPENDNNIYVFLNLDESDTEEYGNSLHEVSDIESEECFGFGYRLIACVTGVTPRIQVFHQPIDIEDGDPKVTLDLTNPDTPKIKFYLQRGQRIEDVYRNIVGSQEEPNVYLYTDGRTYIDKNGETKIATLTKPQLVFDLPKAPTFFVGSLFGLGPLSYFHNTSDNEISFNQNYSYKYTIYKDQVSILSQISYLLLYILKEDKVIYDNDGNIIDDKHFYNENLNKIQIQANGKVLFNPNNNNKITELIQNIYNNLVNNFNLKLLKNGLDYDWYWINSNDNSNEQNLFYTFNNMYPRSLFQTDSILYDIFNILLKIINVNKKNNINTYYYFETKFMAEYILSILNEYTNLDNHFLDIINKGYKADFYINEPTGKIYRLEEITNTQITSSYLGTITAPAPLAKTLLTNSFIKNNNGELVRNQIQVDSSIIENNNLGTYQEIFNFSIPKYPNTNINTINVNNSQIYKVKNIKPVDNNTEQIDLETPLPIHILTPQNSGLTSFIDIIDNNIEKVIIGQDKQYTGPILSKNDLFINITDNLSDSTRGHIFQYKKDPVQSLEDQKFLSDDWEKIGTLTGLPGIPLAKKIINITAVEHLSNNIVYEGSEGNGNNNNYIFNYSILKTYYIEHINDGLEFIIKQILNGTKLNQEAIKNAGSSTPQLIINFGDNASANLPDLTINSESGEVILINFYNPTLTSSYWGLYIQNNWDLISVSGNSQDSIISIQQNPQQEISKKTAYSSWYLDTQYLNNNLIWNKWIGITTKNLVDTSISINGISKTNTPKFTAKEGDKITIHTFSKNKSTTEIGEITSKIFYNNTLMKESTKCQVAPSEGLWSYAEVTYEFNLKNDISIEVISEKYPDSSSSYAFGQNVYITDYLD